jgi:membrane protein DedA with SNARE-associated domain
MELASEPIFQWLSQFAFQPNMVYLLLVGMMLLSSIGLPLPEEVTLLSVGFLAFIGAHPDLFPPPYEGAPIVKTHIAAIISFLAVFCSDFLIYGVGRYFGRPLFEKPLFKKYMPDTAMQRVEEWTRKYGAYACGIFRFTPGLRFPGHLACGMLKFPAWKFGLIDGIAALVSVPTQIYLIAYYGESILGGIKQFKIYLFSAIGLLLLYLIVAKVLSIRADKKKA